MAHNLPSELWLQILGFAGYARRPSHSVYSFIEYTDYPTSLYDIPAISGIFMANKAFHQLALPLLYEDLVFGNPYYILKHVWDSNRRLTRSIAWRKMSACKKRIEFLRTHPHLLIHVRHVKLISWGQTRSFMSTDCVREAHSTFVALKELVEALPSLCTLIIRGCPVWDDLCRLIVGMQKLQVLTLLPGWAGGDLPYCPPPLIPLQELHIDPGTLVDPTSTPTTETPIYQLLAASSSSLRLLGLYIRTQTEGNVDRYIPRRWPHMKVLNDLILESIDLNSSEIGESLSELLRSHPSIEYLHLDSFKPSAGDDPRAALWFQRLVSDPEVLPNLRYFSGVDMMNASSVVPGRPVEDISIQSCPMTMSRDVSFAPFSLSATPITCLRFDVYYMTLGLAAEFAALASELPNVEVFTWFGVVLGGRKLIKTIPKLFMEIFQQWGCLRKCHVDVRDARMKKSIFPWKRSKTFPFKHPVLLGESDLSKRGHLSLTTVALLCAGEWIWMDDKTRWIYKA